jgi:hypothetical protein
MTMLSIRLRRGAVVFWFLFAACGGDLGGTGPEAADGGAGDSGNGGAAPGPPPTMLPTASGTCPTFAPGTVTVNAGGGSIQAQVWAGSGTSQGGMLILYWHGTASSPQNEVPLAFDTNAVTSAGGAIVGFLSNSRTGPTMGNTGDGVWFQSHVAFADGVPQPSTVPLSLSATAASTWAPATPRRPSARRGAAARASSPPPRG